MGTWTGIILLVLAADELENENKLIDPKRPEYKSCNMRKLLFAFAKTVFLLPDNGATDQRLCTLHR